MMEKQSTEEKDATAYEKRSKIYETERYERSYDKRMKDRHMEMNVEDLCKEKCSTNGKYEEMYKKHTEKRHGHSKVRDKHVSNMTLCSYKTGPKFEKSYARDYFRTGGGDFERDITMGGKKFQVEREITMDGKKFQVETGLSGKSKQSKMNLVMRSWRKRQNKIVKLIQEYFFLYVIESDGMFGLRV